MIHAPRGIEVAGPVVTETTFLPDVGYINNENLV